MHWCGQTLCFDDFLAGSCINICAFMYKSFVFIFRNPCFSPWDATESILTAFFCVAQKTNSLLSHCHATVCQWLTQRRNFQWHVHLLFLSSKKRSSSTSFPLIGGVSYQWSTLWKLITLGYLLICDSFGLLLKRTHQDFSRNWSITRSETKEVHVTPVDLQFQCSMLIML